MTRESDWLDDVLDRHPGEPVPEGFADRLHQRIEAEETPPERQRGTILRPVFRQLLPAAAAAAVFLAVGFWMGRGSPEEMVIQDPTEEGPTTAQLDPEEGSYDLDYLLHDWDKISNKDWGPVLSQFAADQIGADDGGSQEDEE